MNENLKKTTSTNVGGAFQSFQLFSPILKALQRKQYKNPTPIQRKVIPELLAKHDVVAMSRTGSGKTAAFVIPMLHHLKAHSAKVGVRAIVLAPSRELAAQSHKYIQALSKYTDLRCAVLFGGDSIQTQFDLLLSNPDIVIATPGRFLQITDEAKLELKSVEMVIFDEADVLFEIGLAPQVYAILDKLPKNRLTGLFSATLPKSILEFAKVGLQEPKLVRLDIESQLSPDLETFFFSMQVPQKEAMLISLLNNPQSPIYNATKVEGSELETSVDHVNPLGGIIFVSTKHHIEYLHELFDLLSISHCFLYGSMDAEARQLAIGAFKSRKTSILIVTDLAARGLDLPFLQWVIHYDFPGSEKLFVHRAGRVARAGRPGKALALVTPEDLPYLLDLGKYLGRSVITNTMYAKGGKTNLLLGHPPSTFFNTEEERINQLLQSNAVLSGLKQVTLNSLKIYNKTKPAASNDAYQQSKRILSDDGELRIGLHHLWVNDNSHVANDNVLQQLRSYRPVETIFEAMKKNTRGIRQQNDPAVVLMQKRRQVLTLKQLKRISETNIPESKGNSSSVRAIDSVVDTEELNQIFRPESNRKSMGQQDSGCGNSTVEADHYIKYKNQSQSMDALESGLSLNKCISAETVRSVLEVQNDSLTKSRSDISKNSKSRLVWDKKRKNFVKVFPEQIKPSMEGSSFMVPARNIKQPKNGMKITKKVGDIYNAWKKQSKVDLPRIGEQEMSSKVLNEIQSLHKPDYRHHKKSSKAMQKYKPLSTESTSSVGISKNKRQPHSGSSKDKQHSLKRSRPELKSKEQILKSRRNNMKLNRHTKPKIKRDNHKKSKK